MANVVTDAETNVIKKAQMAKVRELDFATLFGENVRSLVAMLGITRRIPVVAGTVLKKLTVTGTLQSGTVPEGEIIPLSQYQTTWTAVGEAKLDKWRKATTAEAIIKGGYDQAVNDTDAKMILDIQKGIRSDFITDLATGTGTATGVGLQAALANGWGKLQVAFEDDTAETVYFVNPLDISDYLGTAQITVQTAFGLNYIENFLGLGTVILSSQVTQGTYIATAKENLILYYLTMNGDIANSFELTTDETGYIGIKSGYQNEARAQLESLVMSGVQFLVEYAGGVVKGTITAATNNTEGGNTEGA